MTTQTSTHPRRPLIRRLRPFRSALLGSLAAIAVLAAAGCSDVDGNLVSPTTAAPSSTDLANDWAGERFDVGQITAAERAGDVILVSLDRYSLAALDEPIDVQTLDEVPSVVHFSDFSYVNQNETVRTYQAGLDTVVERLSEAELAAWCDESTTSEADLVWSMTTIADDSDFLAAPQRFAALDFDAAGAVTKIRIGVGC